MKWLSYKSIHIQVVSHLYTPPLLSRMIITLLLTIAKCQFWSDLDIEYILFKTLGGTLLPIYQPHVDINSSFQAHSNESHDNFWSQFDGNS